MSEVASTGVQEQAIGFGMFTCTDDLEEVAK
jgi:hypothetical protein